VANPHCQGANCWENKVAKWRPDLRQWLCNFHYAKLRQVSIGDIYA
jgi:hypothetical protein